MEKSIKYCKTTNTIYMILGLLGLIPSILILLSSEYLAVIKENIIGSKTVMDAFAGTLAYAAVVILIIIGIITFVISLINLVLAINGIVAVKKNSVKGLKINGISKIIIEVISIIFSCIIILCIGLSNLKEDIVYIVWALISIAINAVLARMSYFQISSLNEK